MGEFSLFCPMLCLPVYSIWMRSVITYNYAMLCLAVQIRWIGSVLCYVGIYIAVCPNCLCDRVFSQSCPMCVTCLAELAEKDVGAGESCANPLHFCLRGTICDSDLICSEY